MLEMYLAANDSGVEFSRWGRWVSVSERSAHLMLLN